ncbi:LOW QUALITY PROTEIN: uncharacterized protein [Macrobrachium rosenbergii]|uniref:LOW QUALITY PROTEIN: uncharacterized protein n=1 Tax=Macrobrachium rosenbergii TaxID=79674 RepID=UPI0034D45C7F
MSIDIRIMSGIQICFLSLGGLMARGNFGYAQQATTVTFQTDQIPTNISLARWKGSVPEMTSLTVCMYLKTWRARKSYDTIVSYAVESNFNELYIGFPFPSGMMFEVWWDYDSVCQVSIPNGLHQWWRFCFLLDMEEKMYVLYWNNQTYSGPITVPDKIRSGGVFILGQDQDDLNGGFAASQSFNGIVADFQVFDSLLSQDDALNFVMCKTRNSRLKPIIDFTDVANQWTLEGSVEVGQISLEDICKTEDTVLTMFPEPRLFSESAALCHNLDGSIVAPASPEENRRVLPYVTPHITQCKDGNGNIVHLGVKGDKETGTYYYYDSGKPLKYHNLTSLTILDDIQCMGYLMTVGSEGKWYQNRCKDYELCTLCSFSGITHLKVRGLCADSLFDQRFLVMGTPDSKPYFQGFYYSNLEWSGNEWLMTSLMYEATNASMIPTKPNQYPVGRHEWLVRKDPCSVGEEAHIPLVFTTCKAGQFTCDDGSCVKISQRCDFLFDCPDQSDETNCNLIKIPDSYIPELPPQQANNTAVIVGVQINITSIRAFSLLDLMFAFDMIASYTWRDSRLIFSNLKDNMEMNVVGGSSVIWRPKVFHEEGSGSKVNIEERVSQVYVKRNSGPLPDHLTRLKEDELYKGSENSIVDQRTLTVTSNCLFDLSLYPFDVQTCQLIIRSTLGIKSVKLNTTGVNFVGKRRLLEYNVDELKSENSESQGASEVRIYIRFVNLYNYYISGTYVPTTLLMTITYFTFFFPLEDFTNRIMVSLTALLVLAALFLQTNQAMPRTAYLKLVDVWFVFCIAMDFIIVVILVVINYLRENCYHTVTPKDLNNVKNGTPLTKNFRKHPQLPWLLNTSSRIIVPLGFIFFTIGYLVYTVNNWEG